MTSCSHDGNGQGQVRVPTIENNTYYREQYLPVSGPCVFCWYICHIIILHMSHHHTIYVTSSYYICHIILIALRVQHHRHLFFFFKIYWFTIIYFLREVPIFFYLSWLIGSLQEFCHVRRHLLFAFMIYWFIIIYFLREVPNFFFNHNLLVVSQEFCHVCRHLRGQVWGLGFRIWF